MCAQRFVQTVVVMVVLLVCPGFVSAKAHRLTVAGEGLEFVAQPERGYVVKVAERSGGFYSLAGLAALDTENARRVGGRDRRGVWTVENDGPAGRNEEMIRALRAGAHATYAAPLFSCGGETVAVIPEIVIRVRPEVDTRQVHFLCQSLALAVIKPMEFTEQEYLLEVLGPDAEAVFAAVEQLNEVDVVEWACPNTAMRPKLAGQPTPNRVAWSGQPRSMTAGEETERTGVFPNDEYFPMQWHLYNTGQSGGTPGADIRAPEAWEITTGDPNIVIAVVDMGVDLTHPDLIENLVAGYDFYEDDAVPDLAALDRLDAHGMLCAGVAAAKGNNGIGVTGVAWDCKVMPIRVGNAMDWITGSQMATALRWAAAHGADVLSNSWSWSASPTPNLYSAIVDVTQPGGIGRGGKGCVPVFAAGNSPGLPMDYPNRYPEVIAVGATDHSDILWHYSSYGPELDLMAPSGCDGSWCGEMASFWSTDQTGPGGYSILNSDRNLLDYSEYFGGTSVSCPVVAGVAALILSVNPNLTNEDVRFILCRSAKDLGEPGWDEYYGWGRVDARAAVEMALINSLPAFYVDDDAPNDPGPGDSTVSDARENGSVEHPFDAIQEAIDYALPGRTIVLLDGRYSGPGNVNIDFAGKEITIRSEYGSQNCIVDCVGQGRGFDFQTGESAESVLQGITITGGKGTNAAGIQIKGSSPTIRDCVITGNSASMAGGGLAVSGDSHPVIANCLFAANSALVGGAVNTQTAGVTLTNCTLAGNTAVMAGGAVAASGTMPVELSNCILWDNAPGQIFGGATATYCSIQGNWPGEGNIDLDPLFADPANGDYHLKSQGGRWDPAGESWVTDDVTSPCIDTGDPAVSVGAEPEPNGGRINMGVYGGTTQASKSP